jgi:hypothetical protein
MAEQPLLLAACYPFICQIHKTLRNAEGDRKAFYEASQWTIKQNKETLELVKEENKHFREALALLQKVIPAYCLEMQEVFFACK